MDKQTLNEKLKQLAAAYSCCPELKAAIKAYFDAAGTPNEKSATQNLLAEIEADIQTVDGLVAFAHSQRAVEIFGADGQKNFAAHADELKASGAKYCDCPACKLTLEILENKAALLA